MRKLIVFSLFLVSFLVPVSASAYYGGYSSYYGGYGYSQPYYGNSYYGNSYYTPSYNYYPSYSNYGGYYGGYSGGLGYNPTGGAVVQGLRDVGNGISRPSYNSYPSYYGGYSGGYYGGGSVLGCGYYCY